MGAPAVQDIPRRPFHSIEQRLLFANRRAQRRWIYSEARCDNLLPADMLAILRGKQAYRCVYCPRRIVFTFVLDHIKPRVFGGSHTLDNIQFLCGPCNLSKFYNDKPGRMTWVAPYEDDHTVVPVPRSMTTGDFW